jgi:hypothetical protein
MAGIAVKMFLQAGPNDLPDVYAAQRLIRGAFAPPPPETMPGTLEFTMALAVSISLPRFSPTL